MIKIGTSRGDERVNRMSYCAPGYKWPAGVSLYLWEVPYSSDNQELFTINLDSLQTARLATRESRISNWPFMRSENSHIGGLVFIAGWHFNHFLINHKVEYVVNLASVYLAM